MNFKPMGDCILVEQDQEKEGLIVLVNKVKLAQGTVVAAGPGKISQKGILIPMQVKVGEKVCFSEHIGQKTVVDGKEYLVMHEPDIAGVIDG